MKNYNAEIGEKTRSTEVSPAFKDTFIVKKKQLRG